MKALIIEDVKKTAELLQSMINSLFDDIEIIGCASTLKEGIDLIHRYNPGLIFLDINLNNKLGFDIFKQTNSDKYEVIVTTAYSEYAIQAIKNSVTDFLLKPYEFEELKNAIEKARRKLELKQKTNRKSEINKLPVPTMEGLIFPDLKNIIYIKADEGYSEIFMVDKSRIVSSKRLSYYQELIKAQSFFRVHKTYIVNLKFVKKYQKGRSGCLVMTDGTVIPVAENKKQILIDRLIN